MISMTVLAFRDALPGGGRLMGLDVGTKTIGVALCDAGWTIATAAELMKRGKFSADLERLKVTVAGQGVKGLVVGLPLNLNGSDSPRTQSVRAFARNLARSEERRVGKECGSTCRSRWAPETYKKNKHTNTKETQNRN